MIPHYFDKAGIDCDPRAAPSIPSDSTSGDANRRVVSPDLIVETARLALGTPFRHQGRQVGRGLDCAGLVLWVGWQLGVTCYDQTGYPRSFSDNRLLLAAEGAGFCKIKTPGRGDVACLQIGGALQHLAIHTGNGLIHACERAGRVVEHRLDAHWRRSILCGFHYPGNVQ
ncbi:NlpC/P60 family protein [Iodidimonas gelatinilytica]|uniref:NlpC/P60 family protein n=1 Tax=Iodidimonas gelatinilytica TaxID=1236966 RepID=UPI001B2FF766|nr:NlpC/P60 family protein [Iodidimonas gelatinilytica]